MADKTDKTDKTDLKFDKTQNTDEEATTVFECSTCHQCIRFFPLYVFNEHGARAQMVLGQTPALIMCAGCRTVFQWEPPTKKGAHDGGWRTDNLFEDALAHQKRLEAGKL